MDNLVNKILFLLKKPPIAIIFGKERVFVKNKIQKIIAGRNVLIFEAGPENSRNHDFFIKNSSLPILLFTDESQIPTDLLKIMPESGFIIVNFDFGILGKIKNKTSAKILTYGFGEGADILASDINVSENEINFKINYQNSIVPVWLKNTDEKEDVHNALAAVGVGLALGMNLVEISQKLKE